MWFRSWLEHHVIARKKLFSTRARAARSYRPVLETMEARLAPATFLYTNDGDFDQGTVLNVNHNAPNSNQLQLNQATAPLPFVNIAVSARGTAVRIDVNTGVILGEYFTSPNGLQRNPSRTTVDQFGNVWVTNRNESGFSGGENKGSIMRIALVIGGTRGDKNMDGSFTPNPNGEYLQGPFDYNTALDRDGDGLIRTSRGLGNILPWTNAGGADTDGGVSTAADEAIINYTRVTGTGTRAVAIDANNDVWVGGLNDHDHEKIDGVTGQPIPGTQFNKGFAGYGGLMDGNNVFWSATGGGSLLRYDANKPASDATAFTTISTPGGYGLGIDPQTGNIWTTSLSGSLVAVHSPTGALLATYPHGNPNAQGLAIDGNGDVWIAHSLFGATTVGHLRTDGTFVGNVTLPGGNGPTGIAIDSNGKIWVANINSNNVMRIDPQGGADGGGGFKIGAVDLTVDLGPGAGPYNYSDMTGFVAIGTTSPQGTWTEVVDGGASGTQWRNIAWNQEPQGSVPAGSEIIVQARAADSQIDLANQSFTSVTSGVNFSLIGRFLEVRVTLKKGTAETGPILSDITISTEGVAGLVDVTGDVRVFYPKRYKRIGHRFSGFLTIVNKTGTAINGPITVEFKLPAGVRLVGGNGTLGTKDGHGTLTVPDGIPADRPLYVFFVVRNPLRKHLSTYQIGFPVCVFSGTAANGNGNGDNGEL